MRKNKFLLLLALLLTAATGAWATDVYVVGNGSDGNWLNGVAWDPGASGNKMTEQNGVYSITFNDVDANSELLFKFAINGSWNENYGCTSWDANELNKTLSNIEAGGANFKFGLTEKADVTISFNLSELTYMISTKGMKVGDDAATGYTVSLKDGVKDADKWTVKVGEGQAQALPIGGLKGDGSETVTLQYNGRLKVKGVKATSEAAPAEEPVADIVWDVTNISDLYVSDGGPYEKEGVTMSSNSGNVSAMWNNYNDPTQDGISFDLYEYGGYTFTAPTGKAFTKIEMTALASAGWGTSNLGTGWAYFEDETNNIYKVTWTGSAASTVDLLKDADEFYGADVKSIAFYLSEAAKPAATVTTAPTGAAIVGVKKTTALVSGGAAEGGTMMYKVTTENTKPASTDGFSDGVPTAQTITASGKVYVWYYVKGDDTHSDSEIAATAIEVPVADVVWDATNVFNSSHKFDKTDKWDPDPLTYEGITISVSGEEVSTFTAYDPMTQTGLLLCYGEDGDSFTFTAPQGKMFCKIEIIVNKSISFEDYGDWTSDETGKKFVWSGTAANAVTLGTVFTSATNLNSIAFYLSK